MKVGDKVTISNSNNKCTVQTEIFKNSKSEELVYVETLWRSCEFEIVLTNEWEIETLEDTVEGQYELETEDYEDCRLLNTLDGQSVEVSDANFLSATELYDAGYECLREYYIIHDGVKIMTNLEEDKSDINLIGIERTMTQSQAISEFWVPIGMEDVHADCFDRPGHWSIEMSGGEADSAIYLGESIESTPDELLSFSQYGVNYDYTGDNPGEKEFESILKEDRLILFSHPESDPSEDCTIFIRIS